MEDFSVRALGIGKAYSLVASRGYNTIRETFTESFTKILRPSKSSEGTFWALKDICFDARQGEVIGIIGRNGAGKSTLLKVLSRITSPTNGEVELSGRLACLLEVGTGFHPELTGRENIYLNGAILGMTRNEIRRQFDAIVDFSEVEQFLDMPVKRYSSGMYVRLAFAVAAHLEPEILIVDEVLAVGDSQFQKKCMGKMGDVAAAGRTVFFVSHNMGAVTRLCNRVMLLDQGRLIRDGLPNDVASEYVRSGLGTTAARTWSIQEAPGDNVARLRGVFVRNDSGQVAASHDIRRPVTIEMEYDVVSGGHILAPNFHLFNEEGVCLFIAIDQDEEWRRRPRSVGRYRSSTTIPGDFFAEGTVFVRSALTTFAPVSVHFDEPDVAAFQIVDVQDGTSARADYAGHLPGVVRPRLPWTTVVLGNEVSP
jgi:lipopolysaccharide transport system ATP-binding protein